MKKYIIWDFDGTIANTNDIIIETWQATFKRFLGHEVPVKEIEATFGETLKHSILEKLPDAKYEDVRDFYREYQDSHCKGRAYVFPGVKELMERLCSEGYKIGVATSRTAYSFHRYTKELEIDHLIDELISMEDVKNHKPHPESITALLDKFGGKPEEAIMLGDTKYDIGCANNAGVDSVLVGWSHYVDEEDMAAAGYVPTYRIKTPSELLEII
ncbi:MAG: HAD-IA family hydrolase [Mogibacterium sp.]|nr:HAD-IA family hydrolase [Mogibacterium sp.]